MDIFFESSQNPLSFDRLRGQSCRALQILESEVDPNTLAEIKTLVNFLGEDVPLVFPAGITLPLAADCLKFFYAFVAGRRKKIDAALVKGRVDGHSFLFTRAPNVAYLLDSVQVWLRRHGVVFRVIGHPAFSVSRGNDQGPVFSRSGALSSYLLIHILDKDEVSGGRLEKQIRGVLKDVLAVASGRSRLARIIGKLKEIPSLQQHKPFLDWLGQNNFLPFGYRCLHLRQSAAGLELLDSPGANHGITRFLDAMFPPQGGAWDDQAQARVLRTRVAMVEELDLPSPVYRLEKLFYIGFRVPGADESWFEHAFIGLFSQRRREEVNTDIPCLRDRLTAAVVQLGLGPEMYDFRKISEIFNLLPKVELFFMAPEEYLAMVRSFRLLFRFDAVKVVTTRNLSSRAFTVLIIMPRLFYQAERLERLENHLCRFFHSPAADLHIVRMTDDYLSMHGYITPADPEGDFDMEALERALTRIMLPWSVQLHRLLVRRKGEKAGARLAEQYDRGFSDSYRALVHPRFAIRDIENMELLLARGLETADLWGPFPLYERFYQLQVYSFREVDLNVLMPVLENLNLHVLNEVGLQARVGVREVFIKSFSVRMKAEVDGASLKERLLDAFQAMREDRLENDFLNRLVVLTGLNWREIAVLRAYRNYFGQLNASYSKNRIDHSLVKNFRAAGLLFRYFEARFRPAPEWKDRLDREENALSPLHMELLEILNGIADLSEDKIIRTLFNLIDSTVRTNFFQRRAAADFFVSFKVNALGIIDMPAPRPLYEIYVHARDMEGIHLRGGKVARGGIRWSDRPDDFRTEILGLMKTQMTKNALIVPVGSKGGFIVKLPFSTREEGGELARRAYERLMDGLLDLTDNLVSGKVRQPPAMVNYDEEDPYLVVAADKGTAHLPDVANAVSQAYGFWLGDAFASGGSHGYDHKKLAITARGAWVCVQRHFREIGIDIQEAPFRVIGIGDMSGDVFGNGMLRSRKIRLLGAFNHRHIFLDPNPDPEISFRERERLFRLPRSSWDSYNPALISPGGGVFSRTAKEIRLSDEVRNWLGTRHEAIDGDGLIRLLLQAEADLLWNGGIGTYVKARDEKHEDVGDRSNEATRINADELKVRVVGEGGNLGFTQRARIEYALRGGYINTDAIDNSGGVDCSDHEVNLKIFLGQIRYKGKKGMPTEERNRLLEEVTEEVCGDVLSNNYHQSLCLSLDLLRCGMDIYPFIDLTGYLVNKGLLDRAGEFLPSAKEVLSRPERNLCRPELSILLAYSKMDLYQELLRNDLTGLLQAPDFLPAYFPEKVGKVAGSQMACHPLAREITATVVTNYVIDRAGCTSAYRLAAQTGGSLFQALSTYLVFDKAVGAEGIRRTLFDLDNRLPAERQYQILLELEEILAFLSYWALKYDSPLSFEAGGWEKYRADMEDYFKSLASLVGESEWQEVKQEEQKLGEEGIPSDQAAMIALLPFLKDFLPVASLVGKTGLDFYSVAQTYNELHDRFEIEDLLKRIDAIPLRDNWDRMAKQTLYSRVLSLGYRLTAEVWENAGGNLESFLTRRRPQVEAYRRLKKELSRTNSLNFNPFAVLIQALEEVVPAVLGR